MEFRNAYDDAACAAAYARLEFANTYYLAYRDLPQILAAHAEGREALDFGCGAGRSTRFLRRLGYRAVGVDISAEMIRQARENGAHGDYRLIPDGDFGLFADASFDLILSAFTFDNIPTRERKVEIFSRMRRILRAGGVIVNLVSAPEIYCHEWASFSTRDFPENRLAKCGDPVRIINTDMADSRPVVDVLWPDAAYRDVYKKAGLAVRQVHKPLALESEPYPWVNETCIAPWVIYVLEAGGRAGFQSR